MKQILAVLVLAAAMTTVPGAGAQAATVTFDSIGGANGDPFVTVTEHGITVTSDSGAWQKGFFVGNPVPSLFSFDDTASLEVFTGGVFFFGGFDVGTGGRSNPRYMFEGFLGGLSQYARSGGGIGDAFETVANPDDDAPVDRVRITTYLTGSSANVDNVVVDFEATVPEPATMTLFALAGVAVIRARRRR